MKRRSDFGDERDADLLRAYREVLGEVDYIRLDEVCEKVVSKPSKRFWVSEERAAEVVGKMLRGGSLAGMMPQRRAMYEEIYRRCVDRLQGCRMPLCQVVFDVVNSPAPCFYLEPKSAKIILWRVRNKGKF